MAVIATTISIILAVPLSLGAAVNISVKWVYMLSRAFVVVLAGEYISARVRKKLI